MIPGTIIAVVIFAIAFAVWAIRAYKLGLKEIATITDTASKIRSKLEYQKAIGQLVAGIGLLGSLIFTLVSWHNGREEFRVTYAAQNRQTALYQFKEGTEALGGNSEPERLGGIVTLETLIDVGDPIVSDQAFAVLVNFLKERSSEGNLSKRESLLILKIVSVFCQVERVSESTIDLSHCHFIGVDLTDFHFTNVDFSESSFEHCALNHASFSECKFNECSFVDTSFFGVNADRCFFEKASFSDCSLALSQMVYSYFNHSKFEKCSLLNISLKGTYLSHSEFLKCTDLTKNNLKTTRKSINVTLPSLTEKPDHWKTK